MSTLDAFPYDFVSVIWAADLSVRYCVFCSPEDSQVQMVACFV